MKDVRLFDSFTIFLHAFRTSTDTIKSLENNSIWIKSDIKPDSVYLLNHVDHLLNNYTKIQADNREEKEFRIFEIKTDDLDKSERENLFLYNSFFKRNHFIRINDRKIEFSFCQDKNMLSPKLICIPLSGICIISFGIKLTDNTETLHDLQQLNYSLKGISPWNVQKIYTEKKSHPRAFEQEQKIKEELGLISDKTENQEAFVWTINLFLEHLLLDFKNQIKPYSISRLEAFTYANLQDELSPRELKEAIFRLQRVYSDQFIPSEEYLNRNDESIHLFEKIHYGVSLEGAAIIVNSTKKQFLQNYSQIVLNRYIWLYIVAYHQRLALIYIIEKVLSINHEINLKTDLEESRRLLTNSSEVIFHYRFDEISNNSSLNEFYKMCCQSLCIDKIFEEVKIKTEYLNSILNEKKSIRQDIYKNELIKISDNQEKLKHLILISLFPIIWFIILGTNIYNWTSFFSEHLIIVNLISGIFGFIFISILIYPLLNKKL